MDVFDLFAKIVLDDSDYNNQLEQSKTRTSKFADAMKNGLSAAGKAAAAGLATATTAVAALTKSAVENYAEYEQLVGGVETLFGEQMSLEEFADAAGYTVDEIRDRYEELADAPNVVMKNAANAYKTAGMSANEYMTTVTSFSASLLQSLSGDTAEAAAVADQAIIDMSDNANKMGSDMESIQNAYQGFAKQNYTMLDNLKLGYGGTKAEMERLLADAEAISGIKYDISSYADVINAIHVVQTEMGITGTTAKEASQTISGSVSAMKAAWQNLLTGVADDQADFGSLVDDFVETVGTTAENILPRVEVALNGAGELVETLIPVIVEQIPPLVENVLPQLLTAGINIIRSLMNGIIQNQDQLIDLIITTMLMLVDGIGDMAPDLLVAGITIILKLIEGIVDATPQLIAKVPEIITNIVNAFKNAGPTIKEIGKNIVEGIWNGMKSLDTWWKNKIKDWIDGLIGDVCDALGIQSPSKVFAGIGRYMAQGLGEGFGDEMESVRKDITDDIPTTPVSVGVGGSGRTAGRAGGVTVVQYNTYQSPKALSPAESARQTRLATQRAALALQGG